MKAVSESRILNSLERTIVHKSIEKTQKFNFFWVSCGFVCSKQKLFLASAPEGS
jgi:hypothetical protein